MESNIFFSLPLIRILYRMFLSLVLFKDPFIYIINWLLPSSLRRIKLYNGLRFNILSPYDQVILMEVIGLKRYGMPARADVIVDIGAHIGSFSCLIASKFKEAQVYAYEPEIKNFATLQTNIKLNRLKNLKAFNLAVSTKSEMRKFYIQSGNLGTHSFFAKSKDFIEVECISLKDIFDNNGIRKCDFLKMDCEGAEYEILFNTPEEYIRKIKNITMEYHKNLTSYNHREFKDFLQNMGYNIKDIPITKSEGILYAIRH